MKKFPRWVYAVIGVVVLLVAGLVYAWSVMGGVINRELALPQGDLSLTFTLVMAFFCIGCLIAGLFAKKVAPRWYLLLAAALFLAGFCFASVTSGKTLLYLGFGVLLGLGSGFAYNAIMSTVSAWFPDKQGLISGVLLMGFGLSSFIVGKLFVAMNSPQDPLAWRSSFRLFGMVTALVLAIASFILTRPPKDFAPPAAANSAKGGATKKTREPASESTPLETLKSAPFWLYYAWAVFTSAAGLVLVSQANGIATQAGSGISAGTIATVVGLISICNGVGRVFFGSLFDAKGFRPTIILDVALFLLAGVILLFAVRAGSFALVVAGFVVGGFAYGGVTPTNSAIISDFFGRKNYPMNFSLINTNLLIASFASTIAGKLYDASGSYQSTVFLMLGVTLVGFVLFLGIRRPNSGK